jgi:predicted transporter
MAVMVSLLIILTGVYFSSLWSDQKKEIRVLTQQAEEALKQYLATHPRK